MFSQEKFVWEGKNSSPAESLPTEAEEKLFAKESLELRNEFESGLKEDLLTATTAIKNFEAVAETAVTPEQKKKLNLVREKISTAAKKFLKIGRNISIAGLIALSVDYYLTHSELETALDEKGNIEYIHPDAKTNHILNVLAGRDSISHEEAIDNFREISKTLADASDVDVPEQYDTYDINQIDSFLTAALNKKSIETKAGEIKDYFYEVHYLSQVDLPEDEAEGIYNLIWQIEQECGNPKIRFQTAGPSILGISLPEKNIYRPHYDPLENTVYVPMDMFIGQSDGYKNLIAELSHAKQLKDDPLGFYFKAGLSFLRMFSKGGFDTNELSGAQREEYYIPGSLEHEAHSDIQPQLENKYEKLTKIKGSKGKKTASQ